MPLLANKTVILAALETTYGNDPNPTAVNAMEVENLNFNNLQADEVERNIIDGKLGSKPVVRVRSRAEITFSVALQSSGVKGTVPLWGVLMRGCGFSEAIIPNTSVTYSPIASAYESLAFYVYHGGEQLHKISGARGSVSFNVTANDNPTINFTFTGLPSTISAENPPTPANQNWQQPLAPNLANTPSATLDGYSAIISSLSLDIGNQVNLRDYINTRSVEITNRAGTGSMTCDLPDLDQKNLYALLQNEQQVPLSLTHGNTDGKIIEINAPAVQITNLPFADDNNIVQVNADFRLIAENGNDELTITAK